MKITFKDIELEELYQKGFIAKGKYKKLSRNKALIEGYQRAIIRMYAASNTDALKQYSYLHYEKLKNIPLSSVRILNGSVERLLFKEMDEGIEVELIEINSTHYGNKR